MNKSSIIFALIAVSAASAQAAVYEKDLQDDAANLKFVSSEQTQVVVDEKVIDDGWNDGPITHTEYTMAPGLAVTVSYTAKDGFTEVCGDGTISVDEGTDTIEIAGATKFVSAAIVTKIVTKSEVDEDKSVTCDTDNEGVKRDFSCEDKIVMKSYQAPGKVLQIVTE